VILQRQRHDPWTASGLHWTVPAGQAGGEYTLQGLLPQAGHRAPSARSRARSTARRAASRRSFVRDGTAGRQGHRHARRHAPRGGVPPGRRSPPPPAWTASRSQRPRQGRPGRPLHRELRPAGADREGRGLAGLRHRGRRVARRHQDLPHPCCSPDRALYPRAATSSPGWAPASTSQPSRRAKPADSAATSSRPARARRWRPSERARGPGRFELNPRAGARIRAQGHRAGGHPHALALPESGGAVVLKSGQDLLGSGPSALVQSADCRGSRSRCARARGSSPRRPCRSPPGRPRTSRSTPRTARACSPRRSGTSRATRSPAARLRKPAKSLTIELKADRQSYVPGARPR
jgi:hypothetical protein